MSGEAVAMRASGLAYDDKPGWRVLARAAAGIRPAAPRRV